MELDLKEIPDNEQQLIEQENKKNHQIFKNRLFLTSILNAVVFLVFVFAMSYYDWATVGVPLQQTADQVITGHTSGVAYFNTNLLYAKTGNSNSYQSFPDVANQICPKGDFFCLQLMSSLRFTGGLCFFILLCGSTFQVYDIIRTIVYLYTTTTFEEKEFAESKQDNLRHILTIGLFLVGITLNIFSLAYMDVYFRYGASFWIFIVGIVCFIVIIIYEQLSMSKL